MKQRDEMLRFIRGLGPRTEDEQERELQVYGAQVNVSTLCEIWAIVSFREEPKGHDRTRCTLTRLRSLSPTRLRPVEVSALALFSQQHSSPIDT